MIERRPPSSMLRSLFAGLVGLLAAVTLVSVFVLYRNIVHQRDKAVVLFHDLQHLQAGYSTSQDVLAVVRRYGGRKFTGRDSETMGASSVPIQMKTTGSFLIPEKCRSACWDTLPTGWCHCIIGRCTQRFNLEKEFYSAFRIASYFTRDWAEM